MAYLFDGSLSCAQRDLANICGVLLLLQIHNVQTTLPFEELLNSEKQHPKVVRFPRRNFSSADFSKTQLSFRMRAPILCRCAYTIPPPHAY